MHNRHTLGALAQWKAWW